jgi:hypothetical protein
VCLLCCMLLSHTRILGVDKVGLCRIDVVLGKCSVELDFELCHDGVWGAWK